MLLSASKPGNSPPRADKRTGDSLQIKIDCSILLSDKELLYGIPSLNSSDLVITEVKTSLGKYIQFRVSGGPTKVPYTDYSIIFSVNTIYNNVLTVPITIRAYSN